LGSVKIFAGGFGSGKTEVALNFAVEAASKVSDVVMADLDLVNPYFVSRGVAKRLEEWGINLLAPEGSLSFGDVPHIPAHIINSINVDNHLIIDLAGDEVGSLVLGYLSRYLISRSELTFYFVINPYRPFAQNIDDLMEIKMILERAARLKFTGIISNPNLVEETDLDVIRNGHKTVLDFAEKLGLPVNYLTVRNDFYPLLFKEYGADLKALTLYMRPDWI
jgi:RecA/RadA recombinase